MAADSKFILDLTTVLGTSAVGGYLANRLRQPVLLGYLASGLIVGPYGLKWLSDVETVNALAAIGVAFLLFALGAFEEVFGNHTKIKQGRQYTVSMASKPDTRKR